MPKRKQDWLEQGLRLLQTGGDIALTIDGLAAEMSLTKGSFYHHFQGIQQFKHELAAHWVKLQVGDIPLMPRKSAQRVEILDAWVEALILQDRSAEQAMRAWGQQDDMVRTQLAGVDAARRLFVESVFKPLVSDQEQPRLMADLLLTMLGGSLDESAGYTRDRVLELYVEYKRLCGLEEKEPQEQQYRLPI